MPLVDVSLPCSHLPRSTSFFLAALQPLGYRYHGQRDKERETENKGIGLGVEEPDFYLYQERQGGQAGTAEIAFSSPSRAAVDHFYAAALRAGATSQSIPGFINAEYTTAVFDIDGNSIRVVFRDEVDNTNNDNVNMDDRRSLVSARRFGAGAGAGSTASKSRVLSWQQGIAQSATGTRMNPRSVVTAMPRTTTTTTRVSVPVVQPATTEKSDFSSAKALIGTLLGAAGGAAVAYAMMRAENEDEVERERAAMRSRPTHQIVMIDREIPVAVEGVRERGLSQRQLDAPPPRSISSSTTPTPAAPVSRSVVTARQSDIGKGGDSALQAGSRVNKAEDEDAPGPLDTLGTLISTFIPPSSVPRLLRGPGTGTGTGTPPEAGSASNANRSTNIVPRTSSSTTTNKSSNNQTFVSAKDIPLPASVTSHALSSSKTASNSNANGNAKSTTTVKTSASRTKQGGGGGSGRGEGSVLSDSASTIKAARNIPLPMSSRASVVTVTPSESISNVSSSRRSHQVPTSGSALGSGSGSGSMKGGSRTSKAK
ncbi:MAG: hypothetical protein M1823_005368 [Watsoniomyces obsoletus]|nr:MAG: hypothetical protein M1823_005368 [Watsoniomyces obsoletus]